MGMLTREVILSIIEEILTEQNNRLHILILRYPFHKEILAHQIEESGVLPWVRNLFSCIPDKKYNELQDFGQGQKYCSDPDVLTLCFTLFVMDVT